MGHKVHPLGWRIGYIKSWVSTAFHDKRQYGSAVAKDAAIRDFVTHALRGIPVGNIFITHIEGGFKIAIHSSRVSLVLGKAGENIAKLEKDLVSKFRTKFVLEVKEVKSPETHAALVADNVARQIERRLPYRRVIKAALQKAMEKWAKGIKVIASGRLNGVDIARVETYKEGNIPTQTIRSNIEYATERSNTIYGVIGIKVWIYKGDIKK